MRKAGFDPIEIPNQSEPAAEPTAPIDLTHPTPHIPKAWATNAARLAAWAESIIVQGERFGQYLPIKLRTKKKKAHLRRRVLTRKVVEKHFVGRDVSDLIGVLSTVRAEKGC
jgi:hypothetical protein